MNNARKLRKLYRMTQNDVSDEIVYPKPLYTAFEQGKMNLPDDKIKELAKLYNVSVEYLLSDSK